MFKEKVKRWHFLDKYGHFWYLCLISWLYTTWDSFPFWSSSATVGPKGQHAVELNAAMAEASVGDRWGWRNDMRWWKHAKSIEINGYKHINDINSNSTNTMFVLQILLFEDVSTYFYSTLVKHPLQGLSLATNAKDSNVKALMISLFIVSQMILPV